MTEILEARPISAVATEEQLLAREQELYAKIQEFKFNPAACPKEIVSEVQFLLRRRAKQDPPTAPVETPRGDRPIQTGFEDRGGKFQQGAPRKQA